MDLEDIFFDWLREKEITWAPVVQTGGAAILWYIRKTNKTGRYVEIKDRFLHIGSELSNDFFYDIVDKTVLDATNPEFFIQVEAELDRALSLRDKNLAYANKFPEDSELLWENWVRGRTPGR